MNTPNPCPPKHRPSSTGQFMSNTNRKINKRICSLSLKVKMQIKIKHDYYIISYELGQHKKEMESDVNWVSVPCKQEFRK